MNFAMTLLAIKSITQCGETGHCGNFYYNCIFREILNSVVTPHPWQSQQLGKYHEEPMRSRSKKKQTGRSAGKHLGLSRDWF